MRETRKEKINVKMSKGMKYKTWKMPDEFTLKELEEVRLFKYLRSSVFVKMMI